MGVRSVPCKAAL